MGPPDFSGLITEQAEYRVPPTRITSADITRFLAHHLRLLPHAVLWVERSGNLTSFGFIWGQSDRVVAFETTCAAQLDIVRWTKLVHECPAVRETDMIHSPHYVRR